MTVTLLELLDGLEELAEDLEELADELDAEEGSASDTVPETMISSGGASREAEELTAEEEGAAEPSGTEDAAEEEAEGEGSVGILGVGRETVPEEAPPFMEKDISIPMKSMRASPSFRVPTHSVPSMTKVMASPFRDHVPSIVSPPRVSSTLSSALSSRELVPS